MFTVGTTYKFIMDEPTDAGVFCPAEFQGTVVEIDLPLIKVRTGPMEQIINVKSPAFVAANVISR